MNEKLFDTYAIKLMLEEITGLESMITPNRNTITEFTANENKAKILALKNAIEELRCVEIARRTNKALDLGIDGK